ncbi:MAG: DUF4281 domain-containing protein [Flavobacteriales bacterium TMED235]|nr:MAG: DUF4281 domain-containing protein [Flavobacteriales bacterium TMED235]
MAYETIFNIYNTGILIFWSLLLFFPKNKLTQKITDYPWVPLVIAFGYIYFLSSSNDIFSVDFSSLSGLTDMFRNSNPRGVAAGWLHYLAFDFWMGCWILRDSQKKGIKHVFIILPMLCTFMLGPIGIIIYTLVLLFNKKLIQN